MGRVIADKYELVAELTTGALGTTYRARHTLLETPSRLTLLPGRLGDEPERVAAFQAGARGALRLRHDHILGLLDVGRDGPRFYRVEELVDGPDLESHLASVGAMRPADALLLVAQLARALVHASEHGVVHGSIHPGVVLLASTDPIAARLGGFGLDVRWLAGVLPPAVAGCLAPERLATPASAGSAADVYGLGRLLIAMSAGQAVPAALGALVARATRPAPAERHPDLRAFLADVEAVAHALGAAEADAGTAPPAVAAADAGPAPAVAAPSPAEPPPLAALRHLPRVSPATVAVAAAAIMIVVTLGSYLGSLSRAPVEPPGAASGEPAEPSALPAGGQANRPPAIVAVTPPSDAVSVRAGGEQRFTVTASDPDLATDDRLTYVWEENGAVKATGPDASWLLRPTVPGASEVRVTVTDGAGISADPRIWKVTVTKPEPNRPPRILGQRPPAGAPLAVAVGDSIELGVRATDPDRGDRLAYRWFLDGGEVGRRASWRFKAAPPLTARHRVEVDVADATGLRAPRVAWTIEVTPKMTEVDARDWLDRLRAAWERRDVATLRLYGIVGSDADAAQVKRALARYRDYRVSVGNAAIRVEGAHATVTFDRTEADGRRTIATSRQTYELEKHPTGLVTLRGARGL